MALRRIHHTIKPKQKDPVGVLVHFGKEWDSYHSKVKSLDHHAAHLAAHASKVDSYRAWVNRYDRQYPEGVNDSKRQFMIQALIFHEEWGLKHSDYLCSLVRKAGNNKFNLI